MANPNIEMRTILKDMIEIGASDLQRHSMQYYMDIKDKVLRRKIMGQLCNAIFQKAIEDIEKWNDEQDKNEYEYRQELIQASR